MITALLPSMTVARQAVIRSDDESDRDEPHVGNMGSSRRPSSCNSRADQNKSSQQNLTTRSAGIVGLFTGFGALLALLLFLRLPNLFEKAGAGRSKALTDSYYVVGAVAFGLSIVCAAGLRRINEGHQPDAVATLTDRRTSVGNILYYFWSFLEAMALAFRYGPIGLAYSGGLVARASSIGITLFVPLFVNMYFVSTGACDDLGRNPADVKDKCNEAYVLAAELTGVSQVFALAFAPLFGFLAEKFRRFNICLLLAALAGVIGYVSLGTIRSPEPSGDGGSPWIFAIMALIGISQIGAIVCSLGLLTRSILEYEKQQQPTAKASRDNWLSPTSLNDDEAVRSANRGREDASLLQKESRPQNLEHVKGAIAGVYSFGGGLGILLLTKLGGYLFDANAAAPFYILASFNGLLLVVGILCVLSEWSRGRRVT